MMSKRVLHGLVFGAVAGAVVGTASFLLAPPRPKDKTKEISKKFGGTQARSRKRKRKRQQMPMEGGDADATTTLKANEHTVLSIALHKLSPFRVFADEEFAH